MCLVDQIAEEYVRDTVRKLRKHDQCADDPGIQSYRICQIDQHKAGQQSIDTVRGQISRAVAYLVIPFQISFVSHAFSDSFLSAGASAAVQQMQTNILWNYYIIFNFYGIWRKPTAGPIRVCPFSTWLNAIRHFRWCCIWCFICRLHCLYQGRLYCRPTGWSPSLWDLPARSWNLHRSDSPYALTATRGKPDYTISTFQQAWRSPPSSLHPPAKIRG